MHSLVTGQDRHANFGGVHSIHDISLVDYSLLEGLRVEVIGCDVGRTGVNKVKDVEEVIERGDVHSGGIQVLGDLAQSSRSVIDQESEAFIDHRYVNGAHGFT